MTDTGGSAGSATSTTGGRFATGKKPVRVLAAGREPVSLQPRGLSSFSSLHLPHLAEIQHLLPRAHTTAVLFPSFPTQHVDPRRVRRIRRQYQVVLLHEKAR